MWCKQAGILGCTGDGRPSCAATECLYGAEPTTEGFRPARQRVTIRPPQIVGSQKSWGGYSSPRERSMKQQARTADDFALDWDDTDDSDPT